MRKYTKKWRIKRSPDDFITWYSFDAEVLLFGFIKFYTYVTGATNAYDARVEGERALRERMNQGVYRREKPIYGELK